jgi:hypothetical protein
MVGMEKGDPVVESRSAASDGMSYHRIPQLVGYGSQSTNFEE